MHAVLVSELRLFDKEERENRESHLQRIVTTYMVFAHLSMSTGASTEMQLSVVAGIDFAQSDAASTRIWRSYSEHCPRQSFLCVCNSCSKLCPQMGLSQMPSPILFASSRSLCIMLQKVCSVSDHDS